LMVLVMVFNATINNISVISLRSFLLVEETGVPGKKPKTCRKSLSTSPSWVGFNAKWAIFQQYRGQIMLHSVAHWWWSLYFDSVRRWRCRSTW
jgi:hypothetical protein